MRKIAQSYGDSVQIYGKPPVFFKVDIWVDTADKDAKVEAIASFSINGQARTAKVSCSREYWREDRKTAKEQFLVDLSRAVLAEVRKG